MTLKDRLDYEEEYREAREHSGSWYPHSVVSKNTHQWLCSFVDEPRHEVFELRGWQGKSEDLINVWQQGRMTLLVSRHPSGVPDQPYSIRVIPQRSLPSDAEHTCSFFSKRIREVNIVKEVRCTEEEDRITAWVITEGPAFDFESNKPIYEAAIDTMRSLEDPVFDFRVINLNELENGASAEDIVPKSARKIWKRQNA